MVQTAPPPKPKKPRKVKKRIKSLQELPKVLRDAVENGRMKEQDAHDLHDKFNNWFPNANEGEKNDTIRRWLINRRYSGTGTAQFPYTPGRSEISPEGASAGQVSGGRPKDRQEAENPDELDEEEPSDEAESVQEDEGKKEPEEREGAGQEPTEPEEPEEPEEEEKPQQERKCKKCGLPARDGVCLTCSLPVDNCTCKQGEEEKKKKKEKSEEKQEGKNSAKESARGQAKAEAKQAAKKAAREAAKKAAKKAVQIAARAGAQAVASAIASAMAWAAPWIGIGIAILVAIVFVVVIVLMASCRVPGINQIGPLKSFCEFVDVGEASVSGSAPELSLANVSQDVAVLIQGLKAAAADGRLVAAATNTSNQFCAAVHPGSSARDVACLEQEMLRANFASLFALYTLTHEPSRPYYGFQITGWVEGVSHSGSSATQQHGSASVCPTLQSTARYTCGASVDFNGVIKERGGPIIDIGPLCTDAGQPNCTSPQLGARAVIFDFEDFMFRALATIKDEAGDTYPVEYAYGPAWLVDTKKDVYVQQGYSSRGMIYPRNSGIRAAEETHNHVKFPSQ